MKIPWPRQVTDRSGDRQTHNNLFISRDDGDGKKRSGGDFKLSQRFLS